MARTIIASLAALTIAAALFFVGGSQSNGCLWDSDTLRAEATGAPGMVETIVGRFDRYPPLYYEMRLDRVTKLLEADPTDHLNNLAAYDDAGVACDRLGRYDEAIEWMAKKRTALDALPDSDAKTEHEYRYLANLGTFHAHRWLKNGADRSDMSDIQRARDLVDEAITLNPDAHFGRERYQLLALEWILKPPAVDNGYYGRHSSFFTADPQLELENGYFFLGQANMVGYKDAGEGLAGLVTLGAGWESFDVFFSLGSALNGNEHASLAQLAWLRAREIVSNGGKSLHPGLSVAGFDPDRVGDALYDDQRQAITIFFAQARAEADTWHAARTTYITTRLEQGQHPDTHPDFFDAWVEPSSMPAIPNGFLGYGGSEASILIALLVLAATGVGVFLALVAIVVTFLILRAKARTQVVPAMSASD